MIVVVRREKSCGVLVFQDVPRRSFLLLVDGDRLDLPKGRMKRGESELECALRELDEETGISPDGITLHQRFRFTTTYHANKRTEKTVVLFAGEVVGPRPIVTPDHDDYCWVPWKPPHDFCEFPTIHKGLAAWHEQLSLVGGSERFAPLHHLLHPRKKAG